MRKILFAFFLANTICISVVAKKTEGLIIFPNDTIRVTFKIPTNLSGTVPSFAELQRSIVYFDTDGNKKKIRPTDALEIQFTIDNISYRMLSRKMTLETYNSAKSELLDSIMFLKLEVDGYLKLFSFNQSYPGEPNKDVSYIFQKDGSELKWLNRSRVEKDMLEYLNDCDAVAELIKESNTFIGVNVIPIVKKYNSDCGKN
jgi:hypothetical protein